MCRIGMQCFVGCSSQHGIRNPIIITYQMSIRIIQNSKRPTGIRPYIFFQHGAIFLGFQIRLARPQYSQCKSNYY